MTISKLFMALIISVLFYSAHVEAATVTLNPGANIQTAINANPVNTTFLLNAGVYRLQSLVPKTGDIFDGQNVAILSGAKVLSSWSVNGSRWVTTGQTQQGTRGPNECQAGFPRCHYPEDLFINDVPMLHVSSLSAVGPGKWYFDYANDKIYIGDNPSGKTVETSVTARAFGGTAGAVIIKNLTIEKYATPFGTSVTGGTIDSEFGNAWILQDSTVRLNHGAGVNIGPNSQVLRNKITKNGFAGYAAGGVNYLIDSNEISYNNYAGVNYLWEGGGGKSTDSASGGIIRNNCVANNDGPGIWMDENANGTIVENNYVYGNTDNGIMHEISTGGIIRNNTVFDNGNAHDMNVGWFWHPQILISSSNNVQVYGNTVDTDPAYGNGITIVSQNRSPYSSATGNIIRDNFITLRSTDPDFSRMGMDAEIVPPNTANTMATNTYHVANLTVKYWAWPNPNDTTYILSGMQAVGQELGSTVNANLPTKPAKVCFGAPPPPPPAPTVSINVNPTSIQSGSSPVLVSWTSTNATSCTASDGWSGTKGISGSQVFTGLTVNTTYTLTCIGLSGSAMASATVTVTAGGIPFTIGETNILPNDESGNTNELNGNKATLLQVGTIQSLSYYVPIAAGNLRLGIYDANGPGGGPGVLKAQTNSFVAIVGWNTANVVTPVLLPVGTYWLVKLSDNPGLHERFANTGSASYAPFNFGPMPATHPNPLLGLNYHWSMYATFLTP